MEWRTIARFPQYEVSPLGQIRLAATGEVRKMALRNGYPSCTVGGPEGKRHVIYAHRCVAEAFLGPCPTPLHEACHDDGNRANPRLDNLKWKTRSRNQMDRHAHGTMNLPKGEAHHKARLTAEDVARIRELDGTMMRKDIALLFDVHKATITGILNGRTWAGVAQR